MFWTDCSVRAAQPSHASPKQVVVMVAGFQSSKTPAGKVVMAALYLHALLKSDPAFMLTAPKETIEVQTDHARLKLVAADRSSAGKEVRAVQVYHALPKLVPESSPVARKDVMEVQPCHV